MTGLQFTTIYSAFESAARQYAGKTAIIYLGEKFTYRQLEEYIDKLARALYERGVRKQDKAIVYIPHCPQWIIIWLALQKIGAVAVPVTHFYGPKDVSYIANDCGTETIFCTDTNFGYITKILPETPLKRVIVTTLTDFVPWWKKLIGVIYNRLPVGNYTLGDNIYTFRDLLKSGGAPLGDIQIDGREIAQLLYTGGTTGKPKGVPIPNILFIQSAFEQRKSRELLIPKGEDLVIQGAPLYHILGQAVGLGSLFSGDCLILLPKMNLDAVFDHIERYRATSFFGTPTLYRMILEHDRLEQYNLGSLRYNFSGGDVLPKEVAKRWEKKFGKPIFEGYGATETCGGVALTPAGEKSPEGTAGKIVSFQKVLIVNPETFAAVPAGEPGELLISSEYMVSGYWNKPQETAEHFISLNGRLWYKTGDMVRLDEAGWLYFLDRSVDIIKHKGYRVAASKVDSALQEHPAVIASCTVGIPDEKVGERIKSFVVVRQDIKGISSYDLIKWCKERLAAYEVPQYIEFRDMLPKSKVGKLLRRELRAEEKRKTEAS
ncbi:MAG: AMP-binding protein [Clostridia bacterium]|nr:AMP-binding protein [Clostridia bacterium]